MRKLETKIFDALEDILIILFIIIISPVVLPVAAVCWCAGLMEKKDGEDYSKPVMVGDKNWTDIFDRK